jgi:hypothetical protein
MLTLTERKRLKALLAKYQQELYKGTPAYGHVAALLDELENR